MLKIYFYVRPPIKYQQIDKYKINFDKCSKWFFCWDHYLLKEYDFFGPNSESCLEQYNWIFHFWKKSMFQ